MATPETSNFERKKSSHATHDSQVVLGKAGLNGSEVLPAAEVENQANLIAEVGSIVTIEFLDTKAESQFLITRNERELDELPTDLRARLPEGVKLARSNTPLARVVLGKSASDDTLVLIVQKSRPLKILKVESI